MQNVQSVRKLSDLDKVRGDRAKRRDGLYLLYCPRDA